MKRNWFLLQTRDFRVFSLAIVATSCIFISFYNVFVTEKEEKVEIL